MGFFDFLWGRDKKRESQDASSGYVPGVADDNDADSDGADGGSDAGGGDGGGGGGDGGGA